MSVYPDCTYNPRNRFATSVLDNAQEINNPPSSLLAILIAEPSDGSTPRRRHEKEKKIPERPTKVRGWAPRSVSV